MRSESWKLKGWPVILIILSFILIVAPAQGTLHSNDWCSFEAPNGYAVVSEDNATIVLQQVVSPYLVMQLMVYRVENASSSDSKLQLALDSFVDSLEEGLIDGGAIGNRTSKTTDMFDGVQGRTAYSVRMYSDPYADIMGYSWGESNDAIVMSICWTGSQVPYKYANYLTEPLLDAYNSFAYKG